MLHVPSERLAEFATDVLVAAGLIRSHAALTADCLVHADLRGVSSHGLARLAAYADAVRRGLLNVAPELKVERLAPAVALVDGDNGMGFVTAHRAMAEAIALAKQTGIAAALVRHGNHYGAGAYYADQAMAEDCIAMVMSNAAPSMAPWGGRSATLGTNPLTLGVPGGQQPPLLLDMATSVVAKGRLRVAAARGEAIPADWALTAEGLPTTDPRAAIDGVVLPFGAAKGSGIALFIDMLAGPLAGAAFGAHTRNMYQDGTGEPNLGQAFIAIHVPTLMPMADFRARYDLLVEEMKAAPVAEGFDEILLPGERAGREAARRGTAGIPLTPELRASLETAARNFAVPVPFAAAA